MNCSPAVGEGFGGGKETGRKGERLIKIDLKLQK